MHNMGVKSLHLNDTSAKVEAGGDHSLHARDYVEGMWRMLQQPAPDDYVLATGETHSVRKFVELAFAQVGREIVWSGTGVEKEGVATDMRFTALEKHGGRASKRLERGRYLWPSPADGAVTISPAQLGYDPAAGAWLVDVFRRLPSPTTS